MESVETILKNPITIYWWNMGDKTIDFKGSLGNCLVDKKISFKKVTHPELKHITGYKFSYKQGSSTMTYLSYDAFENSAILLISMQLIALGDKARLHYKGMIQNFNQ